MDDLAIQLDDAVEAALDGAPNAASRITDLRERILDRLNRHLLAGGDTSVGGNLLTSAATTARDAARDDDLAGLARQRREIADARSRRADEALNE